MFDFSQEQEKKFYLNTAGLHTGVTFVSLTYEATPNYECFDLLFDVNGKSFKDRTFGTTLEKAFIKRDVKLNREETKEEAYQRAFREIYFKLLYLGKCFVSEEEFRAATGTFSNLKDLVDKVNAVITKVDAPKLNILTGWKNSDANRRSNLIIPERIQWVEPTQYTEEGAIRPATISLTQWQKDNMTIEKYPYNGNNESTQTDATIMNNTNTADDLPF